ncbi:MAG: hypothetical protein JSW50_11665, partial [Candidatus Latescibacterota bacterium]
IMKRCIALLLVCVFAAPLAFAEEKAAKPADNMEIVREAIQAQKKVLIAENMQLTQAEADAFWPVYEEYQKELKKLTDKALNNIKKFAENFDSMTDEVAEEIIKTHLANEGEYLKLKNSYLPKFMKVLPATKVARYFQLENKVDAVINYDLAAEIPLFQ